MSLLLRTWAPITAEPPKTTAIATTPIAYGRIRSNRLLRFFFGAAEPPGVLGPLDSAICYATSIIRTALAHFYHRSREPR